MQTSSLNEFLPTATSSCLLESQGGGQITLLFDEFGQVLACSSSFTSFLHEHERSWIVENISQEVGDGEWRSAKNEGRVIKLFWNQLPTSAGTLAVSLSALHGPSKDFFTVLAHLKLSESQQSEAKLLASEGSDGAAWYDTVGLGAFESSSDLHTFTFVSRALEDLLGYPSESWISQRSFFFTTVLSPLDRDRIEQELRNPDIRALEYRVSHADGRELWIKQVFSRDLNGPRLDSRCRGVLLDVSDEKQQMFSLAESKEFLQKITDIAPVVLYLYDLDENKNLWTSEKLTNFLGYVPEDLKLMGADVLPNIMHPEDLRRYGQHYLHLRELAHGEVATFEYKMRHKDGTWRWFLSHDMAFSFNQDGKVRQVAGAASDITERKRAEESLRKKQERLSLALDAGNLGIWYMNLETKEIKLDARNAQLLGLEPVSRTISLEQFRALIYPEDLIRIDEEGMNRDPREEYKTEFRVVLPNGQIRWLGSRGKFTTDDLNNMSVHGVNWDITDQKRTQLELEQSQRSAEDANKMKSEFLANMSHEVRTPMSAILGYSDLLARNLTELRSLEWVQTIRRNAEQLLEILDDILDLSKIEANKITLRSEKVLIPELIQDVESLMALRASDKGLELKTSFAGAIPTGIQSDAKRIRQILINLVGNAIKFTNSGRIQVLTRYLPADQQIEFEVRDTGIGIPPEQVDKLFKRFSQVTNITQRDSGGAGLGLAISRRLAQMLGGDIWVRSIVGQGSVFTVRIKAIMADDARLEAPNVVRGQTRAYHKPIFRPLSSHVLVVEDKSTVREFLQLCIEDAGGMVTPVANGHQAISLLTSLRAAALPQVILLDMQMPELDGYETARSLRRLGFFQPIVALTAHAMQGDKEKCLAAGCDEYLSKPIRAADLIEYLYRIEQRQMDTQIFQGKPMDEAAPRDRLLLVDDDHDLLKLHLLSFNDYGYEVCGARNGAEAIAMFQEFRPSAVILDMNLGDMHGIEALKALQQLSEEMSQGHVRFYALTGRCSPEEKALALKSGFDGYFIKPIAISDVVATMMKVPG